LVITRDATNGEIHEVVWQLVKRYIEPENRYLYDGVTAPKPYKIATSTAWGTNMKGPVPVDDELFQIGPSDSIVVLWETANKSAVSTYIHTSYIRTHTYVSSVWFGFAALQMQNVPVYPRGFRLFAHLISVGFDVKSSLCSRTLPVFTLLLI
jgi:hypothetical protein